MSKHKQTLAESLADENGLSIEINQAYIDNMGVEVGSDEVTEAYQGEYSSDEDFVQQLLEDIGAIPKDLPPYIHIDWEWTAREVMMDYFEVNGYYFRSL